MPPPSSLDGLIEAFQAAVAAGLTALAAAIYQTILDGYREQLSPETLDAARQELEGGSVGINPADNEPWDHVTKVQQAQQGLLNRIAEINRRLGWPGLSDEERQALLEELAQASHLLDHSEEYVPRPPPSEDDGDSDPDGGEGDE